MKQLLLAFATLILISNETFSQQDLKLTQLNHSCDTMVVRAWVWFSFGAPNSCPQLTNFQRINNADTMELKLYYNVSGSWAMQGCETADTITAILLANQKVLKGVAYSIFDNDTTVSSKKQIQVCGPTGIKTFSNATLPSIFPHPFSTQLTIQFASNEQTSIFIYDSLGQLILHQTFTNTTTINTESLANGIYFYELRSNKGTITSGKVLKH